MKRTLSRIYADILEHHLFQVSAALSYYFILAIFPGLILLSAILGSLPFPDFFIHILVALDRVLPHEAMHAVYTVVSDVTSSRRGAWLSFGTLGTIWVVSSAFDAVIEALSIAYGVIDTRPMWKTRLEALGLAALSGGLLLVALAVVILGPRFGEWLANQIDLSSIFVSLWPSLRWAIAIGFTVLAVELLYYFGPCVRQNFKATIPGSILSVTAWIAGSHLLGTYFHHFGNYNRTYGVLGGFIAFMIWLYWSSFTVLVGAELNAELASQQLERSRVGEQAGDDRRLLNRRSSDRAA